MTPFYSVRIFARFR